MNSNFHSRIFMYINHIKHLRSQIFKNNLNLPKWLYKTLNNSLNRHNHKILIPFILSLSFSLTLFPLKQTKLNCYKATNKEIEKVLNSLDTQIKNLEFKYHGKLRRTPINYGIRGTRIYIEFNINQSNVDTDKLISQALQTFENSDKKKFNFSVINKERHSEDDLYSYKLDYEISSGAFNGAKNKGTLYLRGSKGKVYDNYLFTIEKQNDFSDLEVDVILAVYEEAFRPKRGVKYQFQNSNAGNIKQSDTSSTASGSDKESDPFQTLHKYGVSVFMPGDKLKADLDWDYLAGYENVKRSIEDTILLGLTHGEVYDQITSGTRMKNETNRPKAILFEGPPGCGKTTSAKIIANQVNIPLIYMPIESIMSKYYGESETRFAEIFEAAKSIGRSIIFIDEVDALASSREGGIHEASRRILSTLLRKIDGFESDGEVLLICATNRRKDLDPALLSRLDISIKFDLPDERMRSLIFQRYAKHLSQKELETLGRLSNEMSGRDIADVCKDAERRWAAMYIRKERMQLLPDIEIYAKCLEQRMGNMKGVNLIFEKSEENSEKLSGKVSH